jgi:hypothetical protein
LRDRKKRVPAGKSGAILLMGLFFLGPLWLIRKGNSPGDPPVEKAREGRSNCRTTPSPTKPDPERNLSDVPESIARDPDLLEREAPVTPAIPPEIRQFYEGYRIALACQDRAVEDSLYPLLLAEREMAVECAREALHSASTPEDRALAEKTLRFLEVPRPRGRFHTPQAAR